MLQRSMEALESEKQALESENAAMRKAMHSLEVGTDTSIKAL